MSDLISRQAAQHKINALIDEFETIMKDIRERHVDDSVCGLCEYDGAFMSDSGNWCNECPGFERDDCFKLKDQYRDEWAGAIKNLPSAQPEPRTAYWTKDIVGSVVCSYCGGIREDNRIGHTQWCNCCGCFMRGEEND